MSPSFPMAASMEFMRSFPSACEAVREAPWLHDSSHYNFSLLRAAFAIAALLGFPWTWITGDITFLYRFSMWIAATGVRMAGIRVHAEGVENVPKGQPCIFMANHVSNLDPPVLLPHVPGRTAVFVKSELMKIPFIGMGMRMGGFVPVDRNGSREAARESIERATKVLASGVHITSFPEGTRSRTGPASSI